MEYIEFLKSFDFIKESSQWRKVQDYLEADDRCLRLEKFDRLEIFQEYLRDLEKEEEEQRKLRMEESRKAERRNRDEFRKLMEDHVAAGTLGAKTHWRDYCMKVNELPAYLAVSSNTSGATANDLFEDVAEELQKQCHQNSNTSVRMNASIFFISLQDIQYFVSQGQGSGKRCSEVEEGIVLMFLCFETIIQVKKLYKLYFHVTLSSTWTIELRDVSVLR